MKKLILASASPRRKYLLKQIGLDFVVIPSQIEETCEKELAPMEMVKELALKKVRDINKNVEQAVVLGADTIVVYKGQVLGKPESQEEAFEMLGKLSGEEHEVITGIAIIDTDTDTDAVISDAARTRVFFRTLEDEEIRRYIKSGEPMDKAGSYAIQGKGAIFVERIEGCYFNVVGLPLSLVITHLKQLGLNL
ncbi:MAG: Maf family protein [Halanaerobium sp.]|nr:Maf family protein [Halanaerobium sp.]